MVGREEVMRRGGGDGEEKWRILFFPPPHQLAPLLYLSSEGSQRMGFL